MIAKRGLCVASLLVALGACAGDGGASKKDARVVDASVDAQQAVDSAPGDLGVDSGPQSDGGAGECETDSDCKEPYAPRCAPATKTCVECFDNAQCALATNGGRCVEGICSCESAADCTANGVWGGRCVELEMMGHTFKMCGCESGEDCVGSPYGPHCYAGLSQCSCAENSECGDPLGACTRPASITDYSFCQAPCAIDGDCAGRMALTHCDAESGACVECLGDEDCAQSPFGHVCATDEGMLTGSCICKTADDCSDGKGCALDAFGLMSCQ